MDRLSTKLVPAPEDRAKQTAFARWMGGLTRRPAEPASNSYRYLSRLLDREHPRAGGGVVLAFNCPDDDLLTTSVLLMQAYCLQSELESSVLIVDARVSDGGRGVSERLGLQGARGYADVLATGLAGVELFIQPSGVSGISVLPQGVGVTQRVVAVQESLAALLEYARKRYGHILLQVGPVLEDTRSLVAASQADAVLLLGHEHKTMMATLDASRQILESNGARAVHAVVVADKP